MTITVSGKVELTQPRSDELRDLSDPSVREAIVDEARRDARSSIVRMTRRARRSVKPQQGRAL